MTWYDDTDDLIALLRETDVTPDPSALERLRLWLARDKLGSGLDRLRPKGQA